MADWREELDVIRVILDQLYTLKRSERFRVLAFLLDREGMRSASANLYNWSASAQASEAREVAATPAETKGEGT